MVPALQVAVAVLAVLSATVLAVLAALAAGGTRSDRLDDELVPAFYDPLGRHRGFAVSVVHAVGPVTLAVLGAALTVATLCLRRADRAALVVLAPAIGVGLAEWVLKPVVHRTLGGGLSFPSGQATGCFTVAFVLAVVVVDRTSPRLPIVWAGALAILVIAAAVFVAMCIVVSGNHYPTDVIAAGALALIVVSCTAAAVDALASRCGGRPRVTAAKSRA